MEVFLQERESFNKSTKFGRTCNQDWQLFTSERKHERCQFRQHKDCTLSKVSMRNFRSNFIQKYISQSQSTQSTLHLHLCSGLESGDWRSSLSLDKKSDRLWYFEQKYWFLVSLMQCNSEKPKFGTHLHKKSSQIK